MTALPQRVLAALSGLLLLGGEPSWAHAQDGRAESGQASPSDAQLPADGPQAPSPESRVAPRTRESAPVLWPPAQPLPQGGAVEVLLVIGEDGRAQLDGCTHPAEICDALAAALLEWSFEPALVDGEPRAARVQVRFGVVQAPNAPKATSETPASSDEPPLANKAPAQSLDGYGAQARIQQPSSTAHALSLEQMRELPGAFGDPFRVIDALPGVVPVMTGLPYVYVRGAPPAATAYFYDDIQLPALFHLGLGPAVVHPAMVGPIDFYPGVAPARYGRKTGGVVTGKAALRPLDPGVHGELELRLVDLQAYLATPFGDGGRVEVGGRYGYPGLAIKLFESSAVVQYWDYQLRTLIPLSRSSEVTVIALGSFDLIGEREGGRVQRQLELQFHRLEARLVQRRKHVSIGTAVTGGFERSGLADDINVTASRVGSKLWIEAPLRRASFRLGADMLASVGEIDTVDAEGDASDELPLGEHPAYRSATGRNVVGAYGELRWPVARRLELEAGLRTDAWITGGDVQHALEPRALLRVFASDRLTLHGAFGLAYQPAVFLIPLPGIADVALDRGLQRAIQTEVGGRIELPSSFSIESKLFAHFYDDMLSIDAIDVDDVECPTYFDDGQAPPLEACEEGEDFARLSARALGSEWLIRRDYRETVSGWLSYTLGRATARTDSGTKLSPNFDVRHVANLVFQWRISPKWHLALRGFAQSGRFPIGANASANPLARARLPPFFRGDFQISRLWARSWGELRFSFDWLNFTFQREPLDWDCSYYGHGAQECRVEYIEFPITLPMLGVRGTF